MDGRGGVTDKEGSKSALTASLYRSHVGPPTPPPCLSGSRIVCCPRGRSRYVQTPDGSHILAGQLMWRCYYIAVVNVNL